MPMKVEAAIVTQKRPSAAYNTDSVNVNGKVFSRDVIKNGYKGSGILSGNVYFALTSSGVEGFADAAVAAFNERAEKFPVARDPRSVFSGFFEDCRSALMKMDKSEEELVSACLYASGRKVVLAKNGNAKLYAVRLNVCTPVTPEKVEDTVANYSSSVFPDVLVGDIFILVSSGVAELLSEKDIEDICRVSDGSVKKIVSLISKVAFARESEAAVSVIAVKVLETAVEEEIPALGFVPDFSEVASEEKAEAAVAEINSEPEETDSEAAEPQTQEAENEEETQAVAASDSEETEEYSEEFSENALTFDEAALEDSNEEEAVAEEETLSEEERIEKKRIRSKLKLLIALSALLVLSIVLLAVIILVRGVGTEYNGETTTVAEETTVEETTSEETTSEETTSEEETTVEETTEEEVLTQAEETTRQSQQTVSRPVSGTTTSPATTDAPSTTEEATSEEEPSSEITTAEEEEPSDETTEEPSSEETEETDSPSEEETESSFSVG
ncbi:MAG: hypothetical protein IKL10_01080 [Clostridia bacterium]|nr:hypothetical protein [Clostridia bacterium]